MKFLLVCGAVLLFVAAALAQENVTESVDITPGPDSNATDSSTIGDVTVTFPTVVHEDDVNGTTVAPGQDSGSSESDSSSSESSSSSSSSESKEGKGPKDHGLKPHKHGKGKGKKDHKKKDHKKKHDKHHGGHHHGHHNATSTTSKP